MNRAELGARAPEPTVEDRHVMFNVAYRVLGSRAEAADAVQEALTRWYAMPAARRAGVRHPRAWLITTTSRICLDVAGSARTRREHYIGEWLPEPVPGHRTVPSAAGQDPADQVALDESVRMALLVVLETLTAAERVVFVLHDVFRYPFNEISKIVRRSPDACRQLAVSARRRLDTSHRAPNDAPDEPTVVALMTAWQSSDIDTLVQLLDESVEMIADGGGVVSATRNPILGSSRVARTLVAVLKRDPTLAFEITDVNGDAGLVIRDAAGNVAAVVACAQRDMRIARIWVVRNPEKLIAWQ